MKPDNPNIEWVAEPQLGLSGKLSLPMFLQRLSTTFKHVKNTIAGNPVTVTFPEEETKDKEPLPSPSLGGTV